MEKWRKGYKVCRRQGNRWVSSGVPRGLGMKIYGLGRITTRTTGYLEGVVGKIRSYGPLGVFDSTRSALKHMELYSKAGIDTAMFSCVYLPSKDNELWRPGYNQRNICGESLLGERYADAVKPTELIATQTWVINKQVKL